MDLQEMLDMGLNDTRRVIGEAGYVTIIRAPGGWVYEIGFGGRPAFVPEPKKNEIKYGDEWFEDPMQGIFSLVDEAHSASPDENVGYIHDEIKRIVELMLKEKENGQASD